MELEQLVLSEWLVRVVCKVTPVSLEELVSPVVEVPREQLDSLDLWASLVSRASKDCRARRDR